MHFARRGDISEPCPAWGNGHISAVPEGQQRTPRLHHGKRGWLERIITQLNSDGLTPSKNLRAPTFYARVLLAHWSGFPDRRALKFSSALRLGTGLTGLEI